MSCIASAVSRRIAVGRHLEEGPAVGLERRDALGGDQPVRRLVGAEGQQVGVCEVRFRMVTATDRTLVQTVGRASGGRRYALLVHPSANRVYALASEALTVAELGVLSRHPAGRTPRGGRADPDRRRARTSSSTPISTAGDLALLGDVSTAMALFELDGEVLRPVELPRRDRFDDDLLTILKYAGKTNELFTKLLLNVTVWSAAPGDRPPAARPRPDVRPRHDAQPGADERLARRRPGRRRPGLRRLRRLPPAWLKLKRLKHTADVTPLRRDGRQARRRFRAEIGVTKDDWKAGRAITLDYVNADTLHTRAVHRAASFDAVVVDAPYGVQHGSRSGGQLARNPLDLLARPSRSGSRCCVPAARWGSPGTPTSRAATTPWRCWPTPGSSRWTTARTAPSGTGSTRSIQRDILVAAKPG